MSRTISEIVNDSVETLEAIISGKQPAGDGDVRRNIDFINNILAMEDVTLDPAVKTACLDVIKRSERFL